MVRTRGGSRYRPRVRFSTAEMEDPHTSRAVGAHSPNLSAVAQPTLAPAAIPEEPQRFWRYQTRMGPRAPSPEPQRRCRRARPSKRARTSGQGIPLDFGPNRHHPQLMRAHHPSFHQLRGLGVPCSPVTRFRGT